MRWSSPSSSEENVIALKEFGFSARTRNSLCNGRDTELLRSESYKIHYRYRETFYHIAVKRVGEQSGHKIGVTVDGIERPDKIIPLINDRQDHAVEVRIMAPLPVH